MYIYKLYNIILNNNIIEFLLLIFINILLIIINIFLYIKNIFIFKNISLRENKIIILRINYILYIIPIIIFILYNLKFIILEKMILYYKYIILFITILYIIIFIIFLYKNLKNKYFIFIISFLLLSFIGTILLMLTKSTVDKLSFIDALFMSTSAVCVTGLSILDINNEFTFIGKIIIITLIEIGSIGILTIVSLFGYIFNKKISFIENIYICNILNSNSLNNIMDLVKKVVSIILIIQFIGSLIIYISIINIDIENKIFFSIFHSISAFCNAGFTTIKYGFNSPIIKYNYFLYIIISFLLIIGGIGFNIILSFYDYIKSVIKKYIYNNIIIYKQEDIYNNINNNINISTYISLITTIILLIIGTIFFYISEYNKSLIEHKSFFGKLITAFFYSSNCRTAGFQILDIKLISNSGIIFTIILMWIGACSGSFGGGIKTSTIAISILNIISIYKGHYSIEIYGKQISYISIYKSFAIISISLIIITLSIITIIKLEPKQNILKICFEVFSAVSTTGLSLGITYSLNNISKIILIILMLIGKIGTLNFMLGIMRTIKTKHYKYPEEIVLIN